MGHRHYCSGNRRSYDGVQRTARPTQFGSWVVSRSGWNRDLSTHWNACYFENVETPAE